MDYLYGKIIYLPRKFYDPKGNKRLGKVLLLEGKHSGKIVNFDIDEPPPSVAVSRNSIVRLHCYWNEDKDKIIIPDITGIMPKLSPAAVMALMKHDLPDIDLEALIQACGVDKLDAVYKLFTNDSGRFKEIASGYLEESMIESVTRFFSKCARDHDFDTLRGLLTAAEPGMDLHDIMNIYDILSHRAKKRDLTATEIVRKEPWIIAQAEGISFKQAEKLAEHLGFQGYPVGRIAGAILKVLWSGARSGHTYVPKGTVIGRVVGMLNNKNLYNTIKNILNDCSLEKHFRGMWVQDLAFANEEIVREFARYYEDEEIGRSGHKGRGIYLCGPFFSEIAAAKQFAELVQTTPELEIDEKEFLSKALAKYPGLDTEQQKAVLSVARNPVTLLTGSAGTGKTEVIAAVVAVMSSYTNNIRLMAPTGIAAQRVNERTGLNASTIHVGVGIFKDMMDYADPDYGSPDESGIANLTVVDETGMCDIVAFNKLLQSVNRGSRLLLVGDPAQLNSPGPGAVLNNLVALARSRHKQKGFGHVNLIKDHRGSTVTGNANRIREGKNPEYSPTFRMIPASNNQIELLDQLLDELEADGVPFYDILVLSSRKGESTLRMGVESLNRHLQIRFNPAGKEVNGTPFRVGDPVICIENDYQKNANHSRTESRRDVFNGERGFITETDADNNLFVQYKDGIQEYAVAESTRWLNLAYALTIHKSQGGESPVVIIVDWDNKRFTRSMLYTAVTRTKHDAGKPYSERVYFIGPDGFVEAAVGNKDELRYSKLYYRVLNNLGVYVSGNKEERSRKRIKVQMISEGAFDEPAAMIAKSV